MLKDVLHRPSFLLVSLSLLLFALGLGWTFAIFEEKAILGDSSSKLDTEELTIRRMESRLGDLERVLTGYEENLTEIRYFRHTFLKQKKERRLKISRFLYQRARKHHIHIERVSHQGSQSVQRDLEVDAMELPLIGRYRDIRAFIDDVELSDMFLTITKLAIEDDSGQQGHVRLQLSLATYFEVSHE